ncbi:axoneme-associated protein mst101(2) [Selaginella moellendorffii]|uniref:axoneme-associated protein mst101(2) n=1 Tax=Selaginella moellendorffii TaxID=88036 RepID=UPI000D1C7D64|nr:axoneme-associated protein mst101(2) [Selaginella moellendorffii]XP_024518894.1 axoneme-associated protein mst101(2) [Selaginella moellendorffii]XP_024518896.1 axoneme-associated protein mst101(2) [Selaginella moellendorffii]XP_024518897.1 axoneme-associated protein mst101(2) [Selaginella moellendorffii]XP_024518898.1 axoneme-associated protein mst101(2) [Selaginella moellendorffii]XP_024518899.1 axoneme-associated protein mst101(2) [Selaginella moellendorffii]XP_024518900.1 axoneme-associ|eukprot:XP_024518893.1 axoneme-associated protein mst101(2) [Selaginella moellendorffii]
MDRRWKRGGDINAGNYTQGRSPSERDPSSRYCHRFGRMDGSLAISRAAFEAMIEEATAELAENERKQREAAERAQEERAEAAAREEQCRAEIAAREEAKRRQEIQEQRRAELAAREEKRAAELVAMEEELAAELAAREKNLSEEGIIERLECADKERKFKKELQERVLERVAQDKNVARPMLWGTKGYKSLWEIATNIDDST